MNFTTLLRQALPWRKTLLICSMLMLLETAVALTLPWMAGQLTGGLLAPDSVKASAQLPVSLPVALICFIGIQSLLRYQTTYLLGKTSESMLADLQERLYEHLQTLPLLWHQDRPKGDTLSLLVSDVWQLSRYVSGTLIGLLPMCLSLVGALAMMGRLDLRLTLVLAMLVPLLFLMLKVVGRRLRPLGEEIQQAHADAFATAEENLTMLPVIKAYGQEQHALERYRQRVRHLLTLNNRERRIQEALGPLVQFLAASALVAALWWLSSHSGQRPPSEVVSYLLYAAMLTRPVSALADVYGQTRMTMGAMSRLQAALGGDPEPAGLHLPELPPVKGHVTFHQLTYAWPARVPVLENLNLEIRAGETVAITGVNGSGKSTLGMLLLRLVLPDKGQIRIDGHDIGLVSLASVRRQIGVVPQQVLLMNGTVYENLRVGNHYATREQVEAAARDAQAHEFICRLPLGYDTIIGDQGIRLSGGQRQRLALARALLKNPPILILDEATAMFDPEAERSFIADCHESFSRRTVILITHRPASLSLADRVLRMDSGQLVDITSTIPRRHSA